MKIISDNKSKFKPFSIVVETEEEAKTLYIKMNTPDQYSIDRYGDLYRQKIKELLSNNSAHIWAGIRDELARQNISI